MANQLAPVRWVGLLGAAALGAAVGWLALVSLDALGHHPPIPSWIVPGSLAAGGLLAHIGARFVHRRFHVLHRYPDPQRSLALVALAKACALGGAALAGAYAVLALTSLPRFAVVAARERVIRGAVTAVAALLLMAGGLALERQCRTDPPGRAKGDDSSGGGAPGRGSA
jgi:hypothetical protein